MAVDQSPQDQRREGLYVLISLCFVYTILIYFMRVWIRRRSYAWDDLAATIATIFAVAHFIAQYVAINQGLGQTITDLQANVHLASLNRANLAGIVLFLFSLWTSKCASIAFLSRFAQPGRHWKLIYAGTALISLPGVASILTETVACSLGSAYYYNFKANSGQCPKPYLRWQIVTAFDIFTEIVILVLPIDLIWSLQMPTKKKYWVTAAFLTRLPVLAFSGIHLHYIYLLFTASDPGTFSGMPLIWREVELTYSLAATTLMTLRPFMGEFETGFGMGGDGYRTHATNTAGYMMSNISNAGNNETSRSRGGDDGLEPGPKKKGLRGAGPVIKAREIPDTDISDDGSTVGIAKNGHGLSGQDVDTIGVSSGEPELRSGSV